MTIGDFTTATRSTGALRPRLPGLQHDRERRPPRTPRSRRSRTPPGTCGPAAASSSRPACPASCARQADHRYRVFNHADEHHGIDEYDPVTQLMWSHHYSRDADGAYRRNSVPFRYAWPAELDLMARLAGMRLRERWAWWDRTPFTAAATRTSRCGRSSEEAARRRPPGGAACWPWCVGDDSADGRTRRLHPALGAVRERTPGAGAAPSPLTPVDRPGAPRRALSELALPRRRPPRSSRRSGGPVPPRDEPGASAPTSAGRSARPGWASSTRRPPAQPMPRRRLSTSSSGSPTVPASTPTRAWPTRSPTPRSRGLLTAAYASPATGDVSWPG